MKTAETTAEPARIPDVGRPVRVSVAALTLVNFKTFARKTKIALREGITTLSGPTGSDVVDAVQFVLGTATVKGMRAERLTDLVYSGRRVARVSLIIGGMFEQQNGRRVQRRLEITRVLRRTRSGAQAHYELDGRTVNPVELHDLMRDLGFLTSGQNVVLPSDVVRLASMSGVALRQILDELAGARDFDHRIALAHEELESRAATLDTERTQVRARIVDLESEKRRAFLDAFARVSKAFVGTLAEFARGEGRLRLESPEDPFAGGMIVEGRLSGKELKPLESMSARAKSLAALAYLLALHEANPALLFVIDALDGVSTEVLARTIHTRPGWRQSLMISRDHERTTAGVPKRTGSGMVTSVGSP